LAANVQLQDVCLALDIVQQKTIQVKVACTISFSSQKFDEKDGCVEATTQTRHNCTLVADHLCRPHASNRIHASRKIRYLQADTGL